uniref:protein O-GlcNAc transferase n=1 Tax=Hanusia phi TaxID=3032 RepID=A0A7S0EAH3_9CRYP|mmetsp:Transcript_19539/g.44694  ORF Transcript_19539/g.44694 Transcript_19539/m.44694 type:complete len:828 (+) Transcript_19539:146-2629(+)
MIVQQKRSSMFHCNTRLSISLLVLLSECLATSRKQQKGCVGASLKANSHELLSVGLYHQTAGRLQVAQACYEAAIRRKKDFATAYFNLGTVFSAKGEDQKAIDAFRKVIHIQPKYATAHYNIGNIFYKLNMVDEAISSFKEAISVDPTYVHAHANVATLLHLKGDLQGAKKHHQASIRSDPGFSDGWMNLGNVFRSLGELEASVQAYETAASLKPDHGMVYYNLGIALWEQGEFEKAISAYTLSLTFSGKLASAYYNLGMCYQQLGRLQESRWSFQNATQISPHSYEAYNNLGAVLEQLGSIPEAIMAYSSAFRLAQKNWSSVHISIIANYYTSLQTACNWKEMESIRAEVLERVNTGIDANEDLQPFNCVLYRLDESLARRIARHQAAMYDISNNVHLYQDSILQANFRNLQVGILLDNFRNGTFQQYLPSVCDGLSAQRLSINVYLLKSKNAQNDAFLMSSKRFKSLRVVNQFYEGTENRRSALQIGKTISGEKVHVLIDVVERSSPFHLSVMSLRSAPVQIHLGSMLTQEADYINYLLSDVIISPPEAVPTSSEKFVYLPLSVILNDFKLSRQGVLDLPSQHVPKMRSRFGLPEMAPLVCSFCEANKITRELVDSWVRILKRVDGSVLWIPRYNPLAEENLRVEFKRRGLNISRVLFSPPEVRCLGGKCTRHAGNGSLVLSDMEYLAAALCADVVLDTGPDISSSATFGSMLWAAIPSLTMPGFKMSSRSGASQVLSLGRAAAFLVARTTSELEDIAVMLAHNSDTTERFRSYLRHQRTRSELFDVEIWANAFQSSLLLLWEHFVASQDALMHIVATKVDDGEV